MIISTNTFIQGNGPFPCCLKPLFQSEAKCEAIDVKMILILMQTAHFHKKGFTLSLVYNVRVFGARNCLLRTLRQTNIKRISWIYFILQEFVFLTCEKHKMVVKTKNATHTIWAFKFLVQFPQLFFLFKRPYCCIFASISARNNMLMPDCLVWENSRHSATQT